MNKRKQRKRLNKEIKRRSKLRVQNAWRNIFVKAGIIRDEERRF